MGRNVAKRPYVSTKARMLLEGLPLGPRSEAMMIDAIHLITSSDLMIT